MIIPKKMWWLAANAGASGPSFDLLRFSVNYRTTDFSYLTSAAYSDSGSFAAGSNVIRVETVSPDTVSPKNSVTTPFYLYAEDPTDDKIGCIQGDSPRNLILNLDWTSYLNPGITGQSTAYDPINEYLLGLNSDATLLSVYDLSGTLISTHVCPGATGSSIKFYYDYENDKLYIGPSSTPFNLQIWGRSGSAYILERTLWFNAPESGTKDNIFDKIITHDTIRIREQSEDGLTGIALHPPPVSYVTEGIAVMPDGTFFIADPGWFHSNIVGGNRLWWLDPRGLYKKYERSPSMTRFGKFSGGTKSGNFDTEKITAAVGQKIYSPVYDTNGFTNTENASAWAFEFNEGGDADLTFVGSATAPTTTPATSYFSDMPTYPGWGDTVPSSESGTPSTFRYKQAVLTVKAASADTTITIQDLVDVIAPELLLLFHDDGNMYVLTDDSNKITLAVNPADPTNYFDNTTDLTRFSYNSAGRYTDDKDNNSNMVLLNIADIIDDTQGQLIVVGRRESTTNQMPMLYVGTNGSSSNRMVFLHKRSADGSEICIEEWGGAASVINRVGIADTSTDFQRLDFTCNGSTKKIFIDNVEQTLNVSVGTNNGNWFSGITTPNRIQIGFANLLTGRGRYRLMVYKSGLLTTEQSELLDDYITQENLLA